jgi:sodium/hydrogen antiporter
MRYARCHVIAVRLGSDEKTKDRDRIDPAIVLYAVLSLTLVRMVPVALASLGSGLDRNTVLFVGLVRLPRTRLTRLRSPRSRGTRRRRRQAVAVIALTVLLSVVAHGLTAAPLAARYGKAATARVPAPGTPATDPTAVTIPIRGLPCRRDTSSTAPPKTDAGSASSSGTSPQPGATPSDER